MGDVVVCVALAACHLMAQCDSLTGCVQVEAPNGSTCDDDDACTQSSSCQAGVCVGQDPVQCLAEDACLEAGTCDPSTGECTQPRKADDSACDDDADGAINREDNCPQVNNPEQTDTDGDEVGDACDSDDDDDGSSDDDEVLAGTDPLDPNDVPGESAQGGSGGTATGGAANGGEPAMSAAGSGAGGSSGGARTTGGAGGRPAVGAGGQPQMPSRAEPVVEPEGEAGDGDGLGATPDRDGGASPEEPKTPAEGCGCRLTDSGDRSGLFALGVLGLGWVLRRRRGRFLESSTRSQFQGD